MGLLISEIRGEKIDGGGDITLDDDMIAILRVRISDFY
jgi:hypothetical protein